MLPEFDEGGAFQIDRTHDFDVIAWGQDGGNILCPMWHRTDGGEQTAEQHEVDDEEEHHEHGLLDVFGEIGYRYAKS